MFVTMGAAGYYLLSTPNVYQRTASLLIKDESKGSSINNEFVINVRLGASQPHIREHRLHIIIDGTTFAFKSPSVLLEVGKQLKLNVD